MPFVYQAKRIYQFQVNVGEIKDAIDDLLNLQLKLYGVCLRAVFGVFPAAKFGAFVQEVDSFRNAVYEKKHEIAEQIMTLYDEATDMLVVVDWNVIYAIPMVSGVKKEPVRLLGDGTILHNQATLTNELEDVCVVCDDLDGHDFFSLLGDYAKRFEAVFEYVKEAQLPLEMKRTNEAFIHFRDNSRKKGSTIQKRINDWCASNSDSVLIIKDLKVYIRSEDGKNRLIE